MMVALGINPVVERTSDFSKSMMNGKEAGYNMEREISQFGNGCNENGSISGDIILQFSSDLEEIRKETLVYDESTATRMGSWIMSGSKILKYLWKGSMNLRHLMKRRVQPMISNEMKWNVLLRIRATLKKIFRNNVVDANIWYQHSYQLAIQGYTGGESLLHVRGWKPDSETSVEKLNTVDLHETPLVCHPMLPDLHELARICRNVRI
eukprot:Gb_06927 [translate_table: standard]